MYMSRDKKSDDFFCLPVIFIIIQIIISLVLFTGCSNNKKSGKLTNNKSTVSDKSNDKSSNQDKEKNSATGNTSDDTIVLHVGDESIRKDTVTTYAYFLKTKYAELGSEIWNLKDGDTSFNDMARQELLDYILEIKVINYMAAKKDIILNADEEAEVHEKAEEYLENISKEDMDKYNLTTLKLEEVFSQNLIAEKMYYTYTDGADKEVTDEKARQVSLQYIYFETKGLSEEDKNDKWIKAEKIKKKALGEKNFAEFARRNSESSTVTAVVGENSKKFGKKVIETAMNLNDGQVSSVTEGEDGLYILYCVKRNDKDATQKQKENLIKSNQDKIFRKNYQKWLGSLNVKINESFWSDYKLSDN